MQKIKWAVSLGILLSFLGMGGCFENLNIHKLLIWNDSQVRVHISKLTKKKDVIFLYGSTEISNYGTNIKTVNLDCLFITVGDKISEKIYVDSVAHILTAAYPLSEESTQISLYWTINNVIENDNLINDLSIHIKDNCSLLSPFRKY